MSNKLEVGQEVWVVRPHNKGMGYEIVTKVGKKYFYTKLPHTKETKFELETLGEHYNPMTSSSSWTAMAYITKQEHDNIIEVQLLTRKILNRFSTYSGPNLSLEDLRQIMKILEK